MTRPRAGATGGVVRILAGRWKGRALPVPPRARPTSSRARQALFNLLRDRVEGARVLDLYAGSGAVGLEAVSRGAASAVVVELDADSLARTVASWETSAGEVRVVADTAARALARLAATEERFDLVFADPPYARGPSLSAELSGLCGVLAEGGLVVLQSDAGDPIPEVRGLSPISRRPYGRNVFHFLGVL